MPVIDVRDGGPPEQAKRRRNEALALRTACLGFIPFGLGEICARLGDPLVRRWLRRSSSPFLDEIETIARTLARPGVWFLHGAYVFGCTALADESPDGPVLRRTLDWPFAGLGKLVEVTRQRGKAGEFLNVTWPGFTGVLTAMAPGRFAACINQAPMRRVTMMAWLRWIDYALNALRVFLTVKDSLPPEHVLRIAFENCATFDDACQVLSTVPVARPVLFIIAGCSEGECVVIERDGTEARIFHGNAVAANAWQAPSPGWEPRVCGEGPPADNNRRRVAAIEAFNGIHPPHLKWAVPPIVNNYTRLAVEMCAATGSLTVAGWEQDRLATAVTTI